MNEKRIQQLIDIERQAQEILASGARDAEKLPVQAEVEAQELIKKVRTAASEEASRILEEAHVDDQVAHLLSQAQENMVEIEKLVMKNMDQAVSYVLKHVIGKA